jgi:molecular chaperone GrpE
MIDNNEKINETEAAETEEVKAEETAAAEEKEGRSEKKKSKKSDKLLEEKEAQINELNDKYLRLAAEYDNFRRRSAKEREGIYADAYAEAMSAIMPVIDNLERASMYNDAEKVRTGLELTFKSFADTLDKLGIVAFGEAGETFDPNLHNAVMHVEDEEKGEGEIVEVFQKGYKRGDKVIRYAMVKVAN